VVPSVSNVMVQLVPSSIAKIAPAATQQFSTLVTGSTNTQVTWSATGGTITNTGLYTAGRVFGVFEVKATSVADPAKSATISILIESGILMSLLGPEYVRTGQTVAYRLAIEGSHQGATFATDAGTITSAGVHTAPAQPAYYEITTTSVATPMVKNVFPKHVTAVGAAGTLSGTITYAGTKTGPIHVRARHGNCAGEYCLTLGTVLLSPGPFTIRGLDAPGLYSVDAFMDMNGVGRQNESTDPHGVVTGYVTFSGASMTGQNMTLIDPDPFDPAFLNPMEAEIRPADGRIAVTIYRSDILGGYKIYWSNTPDPGPTNNLGVKVVPETSTQGDVYLTGLTNGTTIYVSVAAIVQGQDGDVSPAFPSSVVVGPPAAAGNSLTGTVNFNGNNPAGGTLYIVSDSNLGIRAEAVVVKTSPAASQSFTVPYSGSPTALRLYAMFDANNDGMFQRTELSATSGPVAPTSSPTLTFASGNAINTVRLVETQVANVTSYRLVFSSTGVSKIPLSAALSGSSLSGVYDLISIGTGKLEQPMVLGTTAPSVSDVFTLALRYSDGTNQAVQLSVPGVLPAVHPTAPLGTGSVTPTFSWDYATPPPANTRQELKLQGCAVTSGMQSSVTQLASTVRSYPVTSPLFQGRACFWSISLLDEAGNVSEAQEVFLVQ
jgi:hypothetical protein